MRLKLRYIILFTFLLSACNPKQQGESAPAAADDEKTTEQAQGNVEPSAEKGEALGQERLPFTGTIVAKAKGRIVIYAPVAGRVLTMHIQSNDYVRVGTPLFTVGGFELLDLQQDFAASAARLKLLEANYQRTRSLYADSIKTQAEFLQAESDYRVEKARYSSLAMKLEHLGIAIEQVAQGDFFHSYTIQSPAAGQLGSINCSIGQQVSPEETLTHLYQQDQLELQLHIFEKDYAQLHSGQAVRFINSSAAGDTAHATLKRLGSGWDPQSGALRCYAEIDANDRPHFMPNQNVQGEILVGP